MYVYILQSMYFPVAFVKFKGVYVFTQHFVETFIPQVFLSTHNSNIIIIIIVRIIEIFCTNAQAPERATFADICSYLEQTVLPFEDLVKSQFGKSAKYKTCQIYCPPNFPAIRYTVEPIKCAEYSGPLYKEHHWEPAGCPVQRGVPNSEVDCTQLYVAGTADSVLIREVSFIQSVFYREVPLYSAHLIE